MTPFRITILIVAAAAIATAGATYHSYLEDPGALWRDPNHDRHGHYAAGQLVAIGLRTFDVVALANAVEAAKVWPILNDLALGLVLAIGGLDYRLAILPALIAWTALVVMTAVLAWRSRDDGRKAVAGAAFAAALALTSPGVRLLGADVMLDIPGAALTAVCLFLFGRGAGQPADLARWRHLGLALTLLFLLKYNYWLLCVLALAASALTLAPTVREAAGLVIDGARLCGRLALRVIPMPAAIAGLAAIGAAIGVYVRGPTSIEVFGQTLGLYPPSNIVTAGYALVLLSLVLAIRADRPYWYGKAGPIATTLAVWHAVPVAVWLLLPDRITAFLWFIGPTHYGGAAPGYSSLLEVAPAYWRGFVDGYNAAPEIAWAVIACFAVAVLLLPRLTVTGRAVIIFAILSAILVVIHPNRQMRFLSHWQFAVWAGAGVGAARLTWLLVPRPAALVRLPLAIVLAAALCAFGFSRPVTDLARHHASRPYVDARSDLEISRLYLGHIDPCQPHGVVASFGRTQFPIWAAREACGRGVRVEQPWYAPGAVGDRENVLAFLRSAAVDTVVAISIADTSYATDTFLDQEREEAILAALAGQERFVLAERLPQADGGPKVSIWRRPAARPGG